jgi:hypothetical protein
MTARNLCPAPVALEQTLRDGYVTPVAAVDVERRGGALA